MSADSDATGEVDVADRLGSLIDTEDDEDESCRRAARAAQQTMRDNCGAERVAVVREITEDVTVYVPNEASEATVDLSSEQVDDDRLRDLIGDDDWLREFVNSMCDTAGIPEDDPDRNRCQLRFARSILD